MIGIAVIVGLAMALMWRVYVHHQQVHEVEEEPAVVELMRGAELTRPLL